MAGGSWKEGEEVAYVTGKKRRITAGLFWYSGFGMGNYYAKNHDVVWCNSRRADELARADGFERADYVDSFNGYVGTYLGD